MKISRKALRQILCEIFPKPDEPALGDRPEYALDARNPERDEIASIYSDVYKEKYGVRPRHISWDTVSADEAQEMLDRLYDQSGDKYDDYNDNYAPEPELEPEYEFPGTVPAEETPASVRSGGFVRPLGSEEDEPDVRISKSWKAGERDPMMGRSLDRLGRVQTRQKSQR